MGEHARQERFLALLEENEGILRKVAGAYTRTAADREELVQETVAQLWRSFPSYDERYRFSTWMYRVALNVAISSLRGDVRRRRHTVPAEEAHLAVAAPAPDPAEERRALLREAMERLDPFDRALLVLHLDGRPYAEIAEVLGLTETNVGTRLGRVRQKLRRDLAPGR
ncbi:MAG: sigma-70 family RNA polymerase sigma factor [Thermoanaerobaculia bacterium]|nr:sigma-70 family RNA polymerase sigma factor [Thermoanaerobaculia bacterium]